MNTDFFFSSEPLPLPSSCLLNCLQFVFMNTCGSMGLLWFMLVVPQSLQRLLLCPGTWARKNNNKKVDFSLIISSSALSTLHSAPHIMNSPEHSLFLLLLSCYLRLSWSLSGTQSLSILQLHLEAAGGPGNHPWTPGEHLWNTQLQCCSQLHRAPQPNPVEKGASAM